MPVGRAWMLRFGLLLAEILCFFSAEVYIVYLGDKTGESRDEVLKKDHQMLTAVLGESALMAHESHVYSYSSAFRGFAAKLSEEQAHALAGMAGVVSVFPNSRRQLHTTHSWDFMGLEVEEYMEIPGFSTRNQENVIIGFIDTGIWPESPSFSDSGMPPVPSRWKGQCQAGESFTSSNCNRKVIGARFYANGYVNEKQRSILTESTNTVNYNSPRDSSGHGTHTASIAAGRFVKNMSYNGLAEGGARGGAMMARIAVYKTCWDSGCYDADILAAFDDAIQDGVDIISISLGPDYPPGNFFKDAISIGSFHAASQGIMVVSSAGNAGTRGSVANVAPWMLTVAAGTTDRDFSSEIILGDGSVYMGESLNILEMNRSAEVIAASKVNAGYFTPYQASFCLDSSLNDTIARGKILVCHQAGYSSESKLEKSRVVKKVGGVGMILVDERDKDLAVPFEIPASTVGTEVGERILTYANNTRRSRSIILPARTIIGSRSAPRVAAFSSKGPNFLISDVLKPDITAPGLNILAAWSPAAKKATSNIISGTSMSCPHVTGIAALVKAVNPTWSPAAIKSAIMTTATLFDTRGNKLTADPDGRVADPFDYGSGFLNPTKVLDPGLIYDAHPLDFTEFLCSIGYDDRSLHLITGDKSTCNQTAPRPSNLNYPSITVPDLNGSSVVFRTVTNVGEPHSTYRAVISPPAGISVTVSPNILSFSNYGQKLKFSVSFRVISLPNGYVFGSLSWKSKQIQVTSPLVVKLASSNSGLV